MNSMISHYIKKYNERKINLKYKLRNGTFYDKIGNNMFRKEADDEAG